MRPDFIPMHLSSAYCTNIVLYSKKKKKISIFSVCTSATQYVTNLQKSKRNGENNSKNARRCMMHFNRGVSQEKRLFSPMLIFDADIIYTFDHTRIKLIDRLYQQKKKNNINTNTHRTKESNRKKIKEGIVE